MHTLVLLLALTSTGADAYATQHDWAQPGRVWESNPVASGLVSRGEAGRVAYFGACGAGVVVGDRVLYKWHKKWAIIGEVAVTGIEGYWTMYSVKHGKGW